MGEPATPLEAAAIEALRKALPDDGLTTVWTNLRFIDGTGRINDVDVLLLTPAGFFVIELKGWHRSIRGNAQRWQHIHRNVENPLLLTDLKAKRLSSLLKSYATRAQKGRVPFVKALVALHGQGAEVELDEYGRTGVVVVDSFKVQARPPLPVLTKYLADQPARYALDAQQIALVRKLCEKAHFTKAPKVRMVGDFAVEDSTPVAQGPDWADVLVTNPALRDGKRFTQRLRLFDVDPKASPSERKRIEQLAERELLLTKGMRHPGISGPNNIYLTDDGPALLFEYDEKEAPLDEYLSGEGQDLGLDDRVMLADKLGEILRHAHSRHLLHRALSPHRVWVKQDRHGLHLTIRDWYAGQRNRDSGSGSGTTTIGGGVSDISLVQNQDDWLWLAPEARGSVQDVPGLPLDVYGFGALTFLILTGKPPAATPAALEELQASGSLDPRSVTTGLPDELADVASHATQVAEADRPVSIDDVLNELREAWEAVRRAGAEPEPVKTDALDAQPGNLVADRFEVVARRGEGSFAIALGVRDYEADDATPERILKIARNDKAATRLRGEAEALAALDHPRIVRLLERIEVDGRTALLLTDAGQEILAARLAAEGRATLGELQELGGDLIEAMAYLDGKGVAHRDVKPANLGIAEDPSTRKRRIMLFDFSLAQEPADNLTSGTPGYLDPYLGTGRRKRYDRAAEMWAVSATLFEMATGVLPWWGEHLNKPSTPSDRPVVEPTSFEPSVANQLAEFFGRALAPDAKDRFATFDDLDRAWQDVFDSLPGTDGDRAQDDARAEAATLDTPLAESGLSARALSGLARLDVVTVADLLGTHPVRINQVRGLGERYRKEIQRRVAQWRDALRPETKVATDDHLGVERVVDMLIRTLDADAQPLMRAALGLGTGVRPRPGTWPKESGLEFPAAQVETVLKDTAATWAKNTALGEAEREVTEILAANARIMTIPELAVQLTARRGSTLAGEERLRYGTALIAAVHMLDTGRTDPRLDLRRRAGSGRRGGRPDLIVLRDTADPFDTGNSFPGTDALYEVVSDLARAAEDLVATGAVIPQARAARQLREIVDDTLADWDVTTPRLLRLAAAAGTKAAVSGFEELYPGDLDASEAVRLVLRGKPGRAFRAESVRAAVRARFPKAAARLPRSLDTLIREAHPDLVLRDGFYQHPSTLIVASPTSSSTFGGGSGVVDVPQIHMRLTESLDAHRALVLGTSRRRYTDVVDVLTGAFGVEVLDVGGLTVRAARRQAARMNANWPGLLAVDAEPPGSANRDRLARFVAQAVNPIWEAELARDVPLLLINAGPLVRYGLRGLLSSLLDTGTPRPAARWLLVAMPDADDLPHGPGGVLELPRNLSVLTTAGVPR